MRNDRSPSAYFYSCHGFSLVEIAVTMVIIGLLAGGGTSLVKAMSDLKVRKETLAYLEQTRTALISYVNNNGRLPWADTDGDGDEDSSSGSGDIPYLDLVVKPADPNRRVLSYEMNPNLGTDRSTSCQALRAGLSGDPEVVDVDGSTSPFSVAAVIVSAGAMDADGNGNVLDRVTVGAHRGNNASGNPNYIRFFNTDTFDDFVAYIGEHELYGGMCEYLVLAVNNNSGSTVYVYDHTKGSDLGSISNGGSAGYDIISGTRIEILTASGGIGSNVSSTPPTPIMLAGQGRTILIP